MWRAPFSFTNFFVNVTCPRARFSLFAVFFEIVEGVNEPEHVADIHSFKGHRY